MDTLLKSDFLLATEKSDNIKNATEQLRDISDVGAGETNHGINGKCCSNYSSISSLLNSYCSAGDKDAERIKTVADALEQLDHEMSDRVF